METIALYSIEELEREFSAGFADAYRSWKEETERREIPWIHEIAASLLATCKMAGLRAKDWSIGPDAGRSFVTVAFDRSETAELSGRRAIAWLENNLVGKLRAPLGVETLRKRQFGHRAGHIPACPLTGVCFDEDFLDHLRKALRDGDTLREAFAGLAAVASQLLEAELDSALSEDAFRNEGDSIEYLFTEYGQRIHQR